MTQTVSNFDFSQSPQIIQMKDHVKWNVAIYATGDKIYSETYFDKETGEPTEGYVTHMVAVNPETGEINFTDPLFPGAVWQVVLKRMAQRSIRLEQWVVFKVIEGKTGAGFDTYIPGPLTEEEKDDLRKAVQEYMENEVGLNKDDPLSLLASTVEAELVSSERQEITSSNPGQLPS